jgi:methylenetetrahydrofolate reductase (NADPH)
VPNEVAVSFEVYPAREGSSTDSLNHSILELAKLDPKFISVTFGAGGSASKNSLDVLNFIRENTQATPLAHITCVGNTYSEAKALVAEFLDRGIRDFLALRGDLPQDPIASARGELKTAAELVQLISSVALEKAATGVHISVAAFPTGHPESDSIEQDVEALLSKQRSGAQSAISQVLFKASDYASFIERAQKKGLSIPVLPGIMPITSIQRLNRVLELTGEQEPEGLRELLERGTSSDAKARGIEWAAALARELISVGAPGVHLYAFNQHEPVVQVLNQAGIR